LWRDFSDSNVKLAIFASEMSSFGCLNDEATVSDIACLRASVAINELVMSEL
jgi:hypothetical protein